MTARALSELLLGIIPIALAARALAIISRSAIAPPTLLPPPGLVFARLAQLLGTRIFSMLAVTLFRLFAGFSHRGDRRRRPRHCRGGKPAVNALLRPVIRVLAPVPKIALYPAFMLMLGFDHASKIALVFADAVFPILLATYQGALWSSRNWSGRRWRRARRAEDPVHGGAAGRAALDPDRLPHRPCHFLHRGVSRRDDLLDRRARPSAGPAARNFQTVDMFVPLIAISLLGLILNAGFKRCGYCCAAFRKCDAILGVKTTDAGRSHRRQSGSTPSARLFESCAVKKGDTAAILSETQSRQLNVHLAELALLRIGAQPFHVVVPTPRNHEVVPIRSTGASIAIGKLAPVVTALQQAGFVVDCTLEGLMHAPETPDILKAGARILVISNEHPEALERMVPDPALEKQVRAAATCCAAPSA